MVSLSSPHPVSLSDAFTSFLETLPDQRRQDLEGCSPWDGIVSVCKNPQLRKDFVRTLSLSLGNSLRLLLLWKSRTISFPTLVGRGPLDVTLATDVIFDRLFEREMAQRSYYSEYNRDKPGLLFSARKDAAETYSYRRLLKSYLSASKIRESPKRRDYVLLEQAIQEEMGGRALSSSVGSSTIVEGQEHFGLPLYLWDTREGRTVKTKHLSEQLPRYAAISHTWGRWRLEAPVDMRPMVPWLVPQNSLYSVRDLPDGLKKLADKLSLRYVWIDLFCIPQNGSEEAAREISRQADIFGGARTAVAWHNTMPSWELLGQTVSWLLLRPLEPQWPPKFFFPWNPIRAGLLAFIYSKEKDRPSVWSYFLGTYGRLRMRFWKLDNILHSRDYPSFYHHYDAIRRGYKDETTAAILGFLSFHWFSSLWTLQEFVLRPDMLLANKGWELLEISRKTPVPLDAIVHLAFKNATVSAPQPVKWLGHIMMFSGIADLNASESPLQALASGTTRFCTSRRSEAIMSTLGCVEWHRNVVGDMQSSTRLSSGPNRHLLLGLYEYDFILEVLQRYRSSFFSSQSRSYGFFFDVQERRKPLGTILPFPPLSQYQPVEITWKATKFMSLKYMPPYAFQWGRPHRSVNTWELLRDGSVKLSKVGILYQTPGVNWRGPWRSIFRDIYTIWGLNDQVPLKRDEGTNLVRENVPLGSWMDTRWTNLSKYAVVVSWANQPVKFITGFILAEVEIDGISSAKHLAKLADFECITTPYGGGLTLPLLPQMTEVDWIVY